MPNFISKKAKITFCSFPSNNAVGPQQSAFQKQEQKKLIMEEKQCE
jgi:hypothetical protein